MEDMELRVEPWQEESLPCQPSLAGPGETARAAQETERRALPLRGRRSEYGRRGTLLSFALVAAALALPATSLQAQTDDEGDDAPPTVSASHLSALSVRSIGPAFMSGRVTEIAVDPNDHATWYVAAAAGGVWKTENAGINFRSIFDNQGSWSTGTVVIDPNDSDIVWVGSGENNSQRAIGYGDGLYKSTDAGASFQRVGLEASEHIARVIVHPENSDVVWVAAQGPLWSPGGDRGVYKTADGGETWRPVLEISENTGASDLVIDPTNPDVLYATVYQRRRHVWTLLNGGPESGVWKSTDGGESWDEINRGLPGGDKGRIGIAISYQDPNVLYAVVEATEGGGTFRTENGGTSWERTSSYTGGTGQYYSELVSDPNVFDRVYSLETFAQVSEDGGRNWRPVGEEFKHIDNHALWIDPDDSDHLLSGNDGGVYESFDRGQHWRFMRNLPITQFYKVAVDYMEPFYTVCGGTQDNATQCAPSETSSVHGIRNEDWFVTTFGDGFQPAIDPTNPDIMYSESQYGGLVRYDRALKETIGIQPQPTADGPPLRWNWDAAFILSPHDPSTLYFGSQFVHRSDDYGNSWRTVSGDLTRNMDRNQLEIMDRVWSVDAVAKNASTSFYGTIVTISESPIVEGLLFVGTDDGRVQISPDGGATWNAVDAIPGIPERTYVHDLEASLHDDSVVFGAFNNTKMGDFSPYLMRSDDRGRTWTSITGDLPERGAVYTVAQDHENADLLFAGTEFGAFVTLNGGESWMKIPGLPTANVRDLVIQRRENDLVIGTFGRGIWIVDNYTALRSLNNDVLASDAHIFPIERARQYSQSNDFMPGPGGFQGADWYRSDNPEFGATFTYWIREGIQTARQERQADERRVARDGGDNPYPTWEALRAEDREEPASVWLVIRDSAGQVVRRIRGQNRAGIHRGTWDLRHTGYTPVGTSGDGFGPMAIPGRYSVEIMRLADGEYTTLAPSQPFEVEMLGTPTLPAGDRRASLAFQQQAGEIQRSMTGAQQILNDASGRIDLIKGAIERMPQADLSLRSDARGLELRLMDLSEVMNGDPTLPRRNEPGMPGLMSRLQGVVFGSFGGTIAPTQTHREQLEIVRDGYEALRPGIEAAVADLEALEARLEAAGVPYTRGRGIPGIRGGGG